MILSDTYMNPRLAMAIPYHGVGLAGVDDGSSGTLQDITSGIRDLITAYNQQQILQANIDLAKQGKPPINTAQLAPTYNVGLAPDTKNLLILGGLALVAVLLLSRSR